MSLKQRPAALLLDFGGVIFELHHRPEGPTEVAAGIQRLLEREGHVHRLEELRAGLVSGQAALSHWKHSASCRPASRELNPREIIGDFYAPDLPHAARRVLMDHAPELLEAIAVTLWDRTLRQGIPELLEYCRGEGIRLGVVSNAHSGRTHRRLLQEHGLADHFEVQVYSDEVGIRKPNPRMIALAAEALGVETSRTWYVGDTLDRDVAVGRRAGVGAVLLVRSERTDNPPFDVPHRPDAVVDDPRGVVEFVRSADGAPAPDAGAPLATYVAHRLAGLGGPRRTPAQVESALERARTYFSARVAHEMKAAEGQTPRPVTPGEFWRVVDEHLGGHHASWFEGEAGALSARSDWRPTL